MENRQPKLAKELAIAFSALILFSVLAGAVMGGEAGAFDAAVRNAIHGTASPALTYAMRGFTQLGSSLFLVTFGMLVVWWLIATGRRPEATYFVISALGAEAVDQALKFWFQRPRPDVFFGLPQPWGYSFPSGHALVSSCFYLVLAEIVIEEEWPLSRKLAIWTLAALLTGMIGLSRVYLGVHYPTDVLGGYLGGIAWLAIVHAGHKLWRRRV